MSGVFGNRAPVDDTARILAVLNRFDLMRIDSLAAGEFGEAAVDYFVDATGVDAALSLNEEYDAAGDKYVPVWTAVGDGVGSVIGDATGGGALAGAFDGATNQAYTSCALGSLGGAQVYVGKNFSAAPQTVSRVLVAGSNDHGYLVSANGSMEIVLLGKNGGAPANASDGTALGSVVFTDTGTEAVPREIVSTDKSTEWDYLWVRVTANSGVTGSTRLAVAEVTFYEGEKAALTLVSNAFAADASPASARVVVFVDEPAATITPGTDIVASVSRDSGATWIEAPLISEGDYSVGRVFSGDATFGAVAAGTLMRWKLVAASGKEIEIHAVSIIWG